MSPREFLNGRVVLHPGDCMEILPTLEAESVDSVVTDPPYHLTSIVKRFGKEGSAPVRVDGTAIKAAYANLSRGFMGKQWDGGDIAFQPELWAEVLRVLKPGGFCLAMGGDRTVHRLACAIEDAGFEIRGQIMYLYGSGFPKSLDVSKAIDKAAGAERERCSLIGGALNSGTANGWNGSSPHSARAPLAGTRQIDIPATEAARQWAGWGTALKPAHEPVVWAQKRFTLVPDCATLAELSAVVEGLLWSMSSARIAVVLSQSSLPEQREASDSVRLTAALLNTLSSRGASVVTDTFSSPEAASTFLSIALLWNAILAAVWPQMNTSTTSTVTGLTTSLRTLSSLASGIMPENITRAATAENGVWFHANAAEKQLNGLEPFSTTIPTPSATERVSIDTMKAIRDTLARLAVESSLLSLATLESFVLRPAQIASPTSAAERANSASALTVAPLLRLSAGDLRNIVVASAWPQPTENLRPNHNPLVLARKPLIGTVAENVLMHGTGALNVDGCRIPASDGYVENCVTQGINTAQTSYALAVVRRTSEPAPLGRFPANVIHDDSDEIEEAFAAFGDRKSAGQYTKSLSKEKTKQNDGLFGVGGGNERDNKFAGESGTASRFFYTAKADTEDRLGSSHPTVKPLDLIQYLVRLITPPGGSVLDLFAGTGTTGEAAFREGMRSVLIEREAEYLADIERRMGLVYANDKTRKATADRVRNRSRVDRYSDTGSLF